MSYDPDIYRLPYKGQDVEDMLGIIPGMSLEVARLENAKVDKEEGKGLSTNDYTDEEKAKLSALPNSEELQGEFAEKQDVIEDLESIREGAGKGDTAYQKPQAGIPAADLAAGVIPDVSQFITRMVNDLANYYLKDETYTRDEVNALLAQMSQFKFEVYPALPATGNSNVLYLIGPTGQGDDKYEEYVWSDNHFVKIGDTSIDLSDYVRKVQGAVAGHLASLDAEGNVLDSGVSADELEVVNRAFPQEWMAASSMQQLISAINNDEDAIKGKSYLSTVGISGLPAHMMQAEVKVEIMDVLPGLGKVILFTITSSDTAPYHWEYTSAYGSFGEWRSFENPSNKVTEVDEHSTDQQYPSAKCLHDIISGLVTLDDETLEINI